MVECVQGESGVHPCEPEFLAAVRRLTAERGALFMCDEIQCGMYRCGTYPFGFQHFGIAPDVVTIAKGIASGFPMGMCAARAQVAASFDPGDHGSTFGGNPVCAAAALAVLDVLDEDTISAATDKGRYIRNAIASMALPCLGATRGLGLMIGVEVKGDKTNKELAAKLIENGLLVLTAGPALRFLPPLTITQAEMDKGLEILEKTLKEV